MVMELAGREANEMMSFDGPLPVNIRKSVISSIITNKRKNGGTSSNKKPRRDS